MSYNILDPDNVLVQIRDPAGRFSSSDSGSAALVWSTGFEEPDGHDHEEDRPGIILADSAHLDIETTNDADQWGVQNTPFPTLHPNYHLQVGEYKVEVAGPGKVSGWYHDNTNDVATFYGSGTDEAIFDGLKYLGFRNDLWLEFARLGTYTVKQTIKAKYDDDTTDMTDPTEYTDSGTYTFHVGPMADLEVRGGETSPDVGSDQYAITIEATNNGPDEALGAEVTIDLSSLLAGVTVEDHAVSDGDGTYSANTWNLGALKTADHRRGVGKPGAATLTFILAGDDADSATASATIANVGNYTVCIDSDGGSLAAHQPRRLQGRLGDQQRLVR